MRKLVLIILLFSSVIHARSLDSLFEPLLKNIQLLPEYYLRFDISTFALHRDSFYKRQYLAEPHPYLEFCLLSYKNLVASVWKVDFQFGLGNVPDDNVFTVLSVDFGIIPSIEVRLREIDITCGLAHRCFHGIDRSEYPVAYHNKLYVSAASKNHRLNNFWQRLIEDSVTQWTSRLAWDFGAGYFLKEFFSVDQSVLNGHNPVIWEVASGIRYAFYRRRSWIVTARTDWSAGEFSRVGGFHVSGDGNICWKLSFGLETFFTRGKKGVSLYCIYHLDDLPASPNEPSFSLGHARFSRNGLAQIGLVFFN